MILHDDTSRRIDVVADVSGRPLADIQRDINAAIEQIQFPLEYHAEIPTKYSEQLRRGHPGSVDRRGRPPRRSCSCSRQPCGAGSWPLAVFLSLPAALAGAAVAAWIAAGGAVTVLALTAFAAVLAIAGRNAALLSARADELWRAGPARVPATKSS